MTSFKKIKGILTILFFFCLTLIYLFPLTKKGLILLPLDLLVGKYHPWYSPAQILLKNPYMQDSIIQLYPWKHFVFQSFQKGIIPFWNPYQHLGMPFMASMKPMVFYPLNLLFFLGEANGWNVLLFLQILLSLLFSYLLARNFKLDFFPSVLVALAFALNSLMIGVLEFGSEGHVLLWLPLSLFSAKKYLDSQTGKYLFLLAVSICFSLLAGHFQYTAYILLLLTGFIFFFGQSLKTKTTTYFLLFLSIFLGVGLSALQIIPALELFLKSYRATVVSKEMFSSGLLPLSSLFRLLSPDFFGNPVSGDLKIGYIETGGYFGIIPLFFCFYALIFKRKEIFVRFFGLVLVISLLFSLQQIGQILYFFKIPIITSGSGGRLFFLTLFSGTMLAGFGFSEFLQGKNQPRKIKYLTFFTLTFILIIVGSVLVNLQDQKNFFHNIRFTSAILGVFLLTSSFYFFAKRKFLFLSKPFAVLIVTLTFFDLFRFGYRFLTFSNIKFLYPKMKVIEFAKKASDNNLTRTYGLAEPELGTYLNVQTVETYNPIYLQRTAKLLEALQGKTEENLPINKYFLSSDKERLKYTLDFLGVSYLVSPKDANPSIDYFHTGKLQQDFTPVYNDDRYTIYKNVTAYPRFGLYYQTQKIENDQEILNLLSSQTLDFKKILILNEALPFKLESGTGSAKLLKATVNRQLFSIDTDNPALFYLSDTFFPGWKAKVNHQPSKIYQANYNFRALLVPKGKSLVEFSYLPTGFRLGIFVSLFSLTALFVLATPWRSKIFRNRNKRLKIPVRDNPNDCY